MKTINDRIQHIINLYFKRNTSAFCRDIGISQSTMKDIVGGKFNSPSSETLTKILNVKTLNINAKWLLSGEGEMLISESKPEENARRIDLSGLVTTTAPLISQYAAAGYLTGYSDPEYMEQQPIYVATKKYSSGNYIAFEVRGDSMDDGLKHSISSSEIVLCKELHKQYWKSKLHIPRVFVIVHKTKGIIIKEITKHAVENGIITCHSYNPENRYFEVNLNDVAQLFYIKEISRDY